MRFLFFGLILAAVIYFATNGQVLFLPLLFLLPMAFMGRRRRRHTATPFSLFAGGGRRTRWR